MNIKHMTFEEFLYKLKIKIHHKRFLANWKELSSEEYYARYKSYRHSLKVESKSSSDGVHRNYLTAVPNPGAGIGHQLANWIAGYYYAKLFGLKFAHIPFSNEHYPLQPNKWEEFLGFGEGEPHFESVKKKDMKLFDYLYLMMTINGK